MTKVEFLNKSGYIKNLIVIFFDKFQFFAKFFEISIKTRKFSQDVSQVEKHWRNLCRKIQMQ